MQYIIGHPAERPPTLDQVFGDYDAFLQHPDAFGGLSEREADAAALAVTSGDIGTAADVAQMSGKKLLTEEGYFPRRDAALETQHRAEAFFQPGEPYFIVASNPFGSDVNKFGPQNTKITGVGIFGDEQGAPVTRLARFEESGCPRVGLVLNDTATPRIDERAVLASFPLVTRVFNADTWQIPVDKLEPIAPAYTPGFGDFLESSANGGWQKYDGLSGFDVFGGHAKFRIIPLMELFEKASGEVRAAALAIVYEKYGIDYFKAHPEFREMVPEAITTALVRQTQDFERVNKTEEGRGHEYSLYPRILELDQGSWQVRQEGQQNRHVPLAFVKTEYSGTMNVDATHPTITFDTFPMVLPVRRWVPNAKANHTDAYFHQVGRLREGARLDFADFAHAKAFVGWLSGAAVEPSAVGQKQVA